MARGRPACSVAPLLVLLLVTRNHPTLLATRLYRVQQTHPSLPLPTTKTMSTNYQPGPSSSALPSSSRPTPRRRQPIASTSKPKPSTNGNSSDDRDDFFTRRKPATTTRTTTTKAPAPRRVPGSRAPAAASVVQAVAVTVATTSVAGSSTWPFRLAFYCK